MKRMILFDLDGTLVNTKEGITKCAQYALEFFGISEPDRDKLEFFIGPPLVDTFMQHYGFSSEQALLAVEKYRERYHTVGIFECELYPETEAVLKRLKEHGYQIAIASSKPEESCKQIMEHFCLLDYFDEIVGATMDGRINGKLSVLNELIRRREIADKSELVLVGDTRFDAIGARDAGIACVGVTYGFGSREELEENGVIAVCESMKEVGDYFVERI